MSLTRDRARAIKEGFAGAGRARPKKGRRGRQRAPQLPGKEGGGKPAQRGDLHLRSAARLSIASLRREPAFPLHLRAARRLRKNPPCPSLLHATAVPSVVREHESMSVERTMCGGACHHRYKRDRPGSDTVCAMVCVSVRQTWAIDEAPSDVDLTGGNMTIQHTTTILSHGRRTRA